ncbi:hypothetical protein HBB16_07770 [Pseudonocardia sp. MCCB 268]|nr:hypothetical protein [Pseudonocardia cytotoxica]
MKKLLALVALAGAAHVVAGPASAASAPTNDLPARGCPPADQAARYSTRSPG